MKKIISLLIVAVMAALLCACGTKSEEKAVTPAEKVDVNVYMISGPTGMGAVNLMAKNDAGTANENYHFTVVTTPDEIVSKISTGEADIATVATNLAAKLYNKTSGKITTLAANTYGVLYVLTNNGVNVASLEDLKGKKVYTTGQGANPEYIIDYLLNANNINPDTDVNLQFKTEGAELATVWATEPDAVIIAPQPVAATITSKYEGSKTALDLTDEWAKVSGGSQLMMGCVIVNNDFLAANPQVVETFMSEYKESIDAANNDVDTTATLCETYGIVPKAAIAKKALPDCNICYVTGDELKAGLADYFNVLLNADPTSIGGKLPDDAFYYAK